MTGCALDRKHAACCVWKLLTDGDVQRISKLNHASCSAAGDWHSFRGVSDLGVTAVYSGHDHNNNYVATYKKVRLAYG
jgi:hypothetical protein